MAQQPLTSFWPLFGGKSDGQDVVNLKGRVLRNGPSQEQLDDKPNDQGQCDYYRLIKKDDPKHLDWRKKLGGMLLREIGGKQHEADKWQQCILWELPENYVLYEHIKTKADGQVKTVKNHSGGGHDRQDAYLYGYPKGPKKRFRSPIEFFPHLLWLYTDETSDYNNCTCKMCSPQQPEPERPAVRVEFKPELSTTIKREPTPSTPVPGYAVVGRNPVVQIPVRRPSSGPPAQSPSTKSATPVPAPVPTPSAPPIRAPPALQSTTLPQPRSLEQQADLSYNKYLCRTGEVVWFFRPKTAAWGLGLVVRRWATRGSPADRSYLIQPLSHPFELPPQELVTTDQHLKPWLAWSAPNCTFPYLQQHPQLTYAQVDWAGLESGRYGEGIASVDASIMAAKAIDGTYTLFERLKTTAESGVELRHYNGIFLGAEKIWRGEPVRLRIGSSGSDLMVITDIVERVFSNAPQKQLSTQPVSQVVVVGDIYSYATLDAPDPSSPPKPPQQNNNIPTRMVHDMAWRNRMLVPTTRTLAWWKLIASGSKLEISDIKGRWYETSLVFQEPFTKAVKNNEGGNGIWMNSRGDATGLGKNAGAPRPNRTAAFGPSIPEGTQLIDGLDPPNQPVGEQQQQQPQQPQDMQGLDMGIGSEHATFSLDDFMNVDHLGEDAGMDFPF
ncbi:uncharacterized protein K460DRAFT_348061 [Cucurbitaria berberidis CBS 394.84]|uniref:Cryptic loci regulator 2 N-terminal domain-containing protein n=1 Tax=Cucurbitaria berberidis CBS 394.84 TaxID=1168544 RepID=A0A9P4G8Z4_9PLEO|nr:uncharacterized protein K460DRAFT_348061 [Cucurbitaria berberidis CBS 394.84]KAF1841231.1 hypothetical protein K460DRAFT_348061 [Cucurbitaria berberidis CBS 394.84]